MVEASQWALNMNLLTIEEKFFLVEYFYSKSKNSKKKQIVTFF